MKIVNPDYLDLGEEEFNAMRKRKPSYCYGKHITIYEFTRLTGMSCDATVLEDLEIKDD